MRRGGIFVTNHSECASNVFPLDTDRAEPVHTNVSSGQTLLSLVFTSFLFFRSIMESSKAVRALGSQRLSPSKQTWKDPFGHFTTFQCVSQCFTTSHNVSLCLSSYLGIIVATQHPLQCVLQWTIYSVHVNRELQNLFLMESGLVKILKWRTKEPIPNTILIKL